MFIYWLQFALHRKKHCQSRYGLRYQWLRILGGPDVQSRVLKESVKQLRISCYGRMMMMAALVNSASASAGYGSSGTQHCWKLAPASRLESFVLVVQSGMCAQRLFISLRIGTFACVAHKRRLSTGICSSTWNRKSAESLFRWMQIVPWRKFVVIKIHLDLGISSTANGLSL